MNEKSSSIKNTRVDDAHHPQKRHILVTVLGVIATACDQLSNIPQIVDNFKSKDTSQMALSSVLLSLASSLCWFVYSLINKDKLVMTSSFLDMTSAFILVYQKIVYSKPKKNIK